MKKVSEIAPIQKTSSDNAAESPQNNPPEVSTDLINELFRLMLTHCGGSYREFKDDELRRKDLKKIWGERLCDSGLTTMEQIQVGVKHLISKNMPFIPNVNEFIVWCKTPKDWPSLEKLIENTNSYRKQKQDPAYIKWQYGKLFKFRPLVKHFYTKLDWFYLDRAGEMRIKNDHFAEVYQELIASGWKESDYEEPIAIESDFSKAERRRSKMTSREIKEEKEKSNKSRLEALKGLNL